MRWTTITMAVVLFAGTAWTAAGQQAALTDSLHSPTLARLSAAVGSAGTDATGAISDFWTRMEADGAPLVERSQAPGHSLVTFVFQGKEDIEGVRLDSNLVALLVDGVTVDFESLGRMEWLPETDVWYLTFRLRNDIRIPYRFEVTRVATTGSEPAGAAEVERLDAPEAGRPTSSTETVLDPHNPSIWEPDQRGLAASILELSGAPAQPWRAFSESDEGDWDEWVFDEGPDQGRTVYVYKPAAWDPERGEPYPVVVGLGAFGHGIGMRVDRVVDHLIAAGLLEPVVVALADLEGESEPTRYEVTADFVAERFLPWLRDRYGVSARPEDVVVSGTSRRGMVASLVAFRRPDAVGNVLSLSGSYYWKPADEIEYEWVPRLYADHPRLPVRFYLTAGELETVVTPGNAGHYMVATNRRFRDVLTAAGYRLTYTEFNGVHSELSWQDGLARGLVELLGTR